MGARRMVSSGTVMAAIVPAQCRADFHPRRDGGRGGPPGTQGAPPRPPRRWPATADDHRAGPGDRLRGPAETDADELAAWFRAAPTAVARAVPRDLRPHRRGDADARRDRAGRRRVRRGPRRGRGRLRRGALRARAVDRAAGYAWTRWSRPLDGFRTGRSAPRPPARPITSGRSRPPCASPPGRVEIAELAVRYRDEGVVGFDIAGPEAGYPPEPPPRRVPAVHGSFHLTIHAGEGYGLPSIREALDLRRRAARPRRPDRRRHRGRCDGRLTRPAGRVRPRPADPARAVPDVQRPHRAVASIADHPFDLLRRLRFRVTVNTDNRLMSGVTLRASSRRSMRPSGSASARWSG